MRLALPLFGILGLVACNRVPPEPSAVDAHIAPAQSSGADNAPAALTSTAAPAGSATGCIHDMSKDPPPPVSAAPASMCPNDPTHNAKLRRTTIHVGARSLDVEIAETDAESEKGLMYRTHMPEEQGMLFDLHIVKDHEFWMHNTCIPLDMLFVDASGTIVGILENVPVLNDEPRSVGCPSSWVLETNAGWARRHDVHPGDKIVLPKKN